MVSPYLKLLLVLVVCFALLCCYLPPFCIADDFDADLEDEPVYEEEDQGILGSVFSFVGDVIAFPFRVIGGVFDSIF